MTRTKSETNLTLNCVELKRSAQQKIYAETKDMTPADEIAYLRSRAQSGPLGAWWKQISNPKLPRKDSRVLSRPGKG